MRQGARRLALAAAALLPLHTLAGEMPASAFVLVAKRDISGKTGNPERSVEVFADGSIALRDGSGEVLAKGRLSAADLMAFQTLLSDRDLLAAPLDCGPPMGADLPETELAVGYSGKTATLRIPPECSLPPDIERLQRLLDQAERRYLPGG